MITHVVVFFLAISIALIPLFKDRKYGIMIIIFLMPMAQRSVYLFDICASFLSVLIYSLFVGEVFSLRRRFKFAEFFSVRYRWHLLFIILIIMLSLFVYLFEGLPKNITLLEKNESFAVTNYLTTLIAALVFYMILIKDIRSESRMHIYLLTFVATIYFMSVALFAINVLHVSLPEALSPVSITGSSDSAKRILELSGDVSEHAYFSGYIGFNENFAEYLFFIYICCFLLLFGTFSSKLYKWLSYGGIAQVFFYCIPTANKTLPLLLGFFTFIFLIIIKGYRYKLIAVCVLFLTLATYVYLQDYLANSFLVERYGSVANKYSQMDGGLSLNNFARLIGREDLLSYFPDILWTAGILGVGPIVAWKINGSNIVYHNLYYSLLTSFGLLGLFVIVALPLRVAAKLCRTVICENQSYRSSIFLISFVLLLLEEVKVSALRIPFGGFAFAFFLALAVATSDLELRTIRKSRFPKKR